MRFASRYSCECHMEKSFESWASILRWKLAKLHPDRIRWVTQGFVSLFVCLFVCLFACLLVCLFVCFFVCSVVQ